MMIPHFMDICREIARRGMWIEEIATNGSFITAELLSQFAALGFKPLIKLSFDGIGHHDWFRDKQGSEQEALYKAKLLHDNGFRVRFQTNVHRGNIDTMLPTVKLADSIGIEEIRIIRTTEAPRWLEKGGDLCLNIEEYYDFALDFTRAFLAEELKISVDIWQAFQFWPRSKTYHHRPIEGGLQMYRDSLPVCRGARGQIAVTPEGDILPCNQMSGYFKKHGICMGNVHTTPLKELLNEGKYLKSVCYTVGELQKENPECQACKHWKLCLGGCRALGILFGGGYKKMDPAKCVYFNQYLDRFSDLFDESWRCIDDID
jgi:radical SAM protein with 4Fe4S-binding SPASM domain